MIIVAGRIILHSETRSEAILHAQTMAKASQAEPGCLCYKFYSDLEDPNTLFIFEQWESKDALAAHFKTPHMAVFQSQIAKYVKGPLSIEQYNATVIKEM